MKKNNRSAAVRVVIQRASVYPELPSPHSLQRWCKVVLAQQKIRHAEICIRLVDGRESAVLNRRYRGKRGATNVLSFPAALPNAVPDANLGDLVICAPVVAREARQQGKALRAHWAHMVVHGTLHLLDFDHQTPRAADRMEALEIRLLDTLGFPNPYNADT